MLQIIALIVVSGGLAVFMSNRLYVLFKKKKLTVKGITYSLEQRPIYYWFLVVAATFGLLAGLAIFVLSATALHSLVE